MWFVCVCFLGVSYHDNSKLRVIVVRDPQKHTQTNPQTGPITIHCTTKLSAQCNNSKWRFFFVLCPTSIKLHGRPTNDAHQLFRDLGKRLSAASDDHRDGLYCIKGFPLFLFCCRTVFWLNKVDSAFTTISIFSSTRNVCFPGKIIIKLEALGDSKPPPMQPILQNSYIIAPIPQW